MKKRVFIILVFLLLGAIVNVAVAWGCRFASLGSFEWIRKSEEQSFGNEFSGGFSEPAEVVQVVQYNGFGRTFRIAKARLPSEFRPAAISVREIGQTDLFGKRVGYTLQTIPMGPTTIEVKREAQVVVEDLAWPLRSFRHVRRNVVGTMSTTPPAPGLTPATDHLHWLGRATPIWSGFAINTVFYAVILWALFAATFALRRRRRIRRGLCPWCAYPIGIGFVCTECGRILGLHPREI